MNVSNLLFSDKRMICQCPEHPPCRRHDVPRRKTDCSPPWTVLHLHTNYYHSNGRVHIRVNNNGITFTQPPARGTVSDSGAVYSGGVFNLKAGDVISLDPSSYTPGVPTKIYIYTQHTYFGAYYLI